MASLRTFLEGYQTPEHATSTTTSARVRALQRWRSNVYDGQWCNGPIPKLTPFSYFHREWEVRVSNFPFMGWGLFALQPAKEGEELLPFVGPQYNLAEYRILSKAQPRVKSYAMEIEPKLYIDGDVLKGNVAGFINSSIGRLEIGNVVWESRMLPKPWNKQEWGYVITIASRDILAGEELYASYSLNQQSAL
jgi:hypothetical protein